MRLLASFLLFALLAASAAIGVVDAFYLPGVAPTNYEKGQEIGIKVIKLDSIKTQLPYDYYSLPFCRPPTVEEAAENLGEVLSGDRIENSMYKVIMDMPESCQIVCRMAYDDEKLEKFADKIEEEYRVNWLLDNIPAATKYYTAALPSDDTKEPYVQHYEKGFALGFVGHPDVQNSEAGVKYLNNHLRLIVFYHQDEKSFKGSRVVGFEVEAYSVAHKLQSPQGWSEPTADEYNDQGGYLQLINSKNKLSTCNPAPGEKVMPQRVSDFLEGATADDKTIIFTYDVHWEASDIKWASRWDLYLKMTDSKIHWFSIINSIMIVLFLSGTNNTYVECVRKYNAVTMMAVDPTSNRLPVSFSHPPLSSTVCVCLRVCVSRYGRRDHASYLAQRSLSLQQRAAE